MRRGSRENKDRKGRRGNKGPRESGDHRAPPLRAASYERGRSPFWSAIPMLIGEPDPDPWPDPAPLLGLLADAGARVEGLRLLDGRFVLKVEQGNALLQILVPWRSPFWSAIPMLIGEPDPDPWPDPVPLLGLLADAGARVEGLRLLDGRFVLKVEQGNALLQILVPSGRAFAPGDGLMAKLGLSLPLEAAVGRVEDLWRVAGRLPPPRSGRVRRRKTRSF